MGLRGRKKGSNGEESKVLLLNIAAEEFAQKGYYETKVSTIVKKAKLTQPTFYLYFQSKEAIFQELVNSFRAELFNFVEKSRLESGLEIGSLAEKIKIGLTAIFSFFVENPNITKIGFFLTPQAEEVKVNLATQITDNLTKEVEDGYFQTNVDLRTVAESLVGIMERLTVTKLFTGIKEPESLADDIVNLLLFGISSTTNE
ncbi:TetR/AcrR family transcriptional regulator [Virgibacillus necropolis]|uniref:TetR family transcriptional regulator n=1 Tax=Virgibacillus necropolis TaxID=163877 RepID=A0A221MAZ1_9BACI|nr:TetR/AcrR family transcriptional regulator [Virgibacillus necropolis]ASN04797.1 TetR family transcriptional regulator [Virgibacillus necropolis]